MGERRDLNAVFSKTLGVLGHAEFFQPVDNLLHCGHPTDNAIRSGPRTKSPLYAPPYNGVLSGSERRFARKNNPDFGVLAGLRINLDSSRMLLHDDVVSGGQAKASTLASGFCCEEWIEHLFPYFGRNAGTVVANPDFNFV